MNEHIDYLIKVFDEYKKASYIHYNIPENEYEHYNNTITWVKSLKLDRDKYGGLEFDEEQTLFDENIRALRSRLNYYRGIKSIYDKTSFVIRREDNLSSLRIDSDNILGIYIEDSVKLKLNEAIDLLEKKIQEFERFERAVKSWMF